MHIKQIIKTTKMMNANHIEKTTFQALLYTAGLLLYLFPRGNGRVFYSSSLFFIHEKRSAFYIFTALNEVVEIIGGFFFSFVIELAVEGEEVLLVGGEGGGGIGLTECCFALEVFGGCAEEACDLVDVLSVGFIPTTFPFGKNVFAYTKEVGQFFL